MLFMNVYLAKYPSTFVLSVSMRSVLLILVLWYLFAVQLDLVLNTSIGIRANCDMKRGVLHARHLIHDSGTLGCVIRMRSIER